MSVEIKVASVDPIRTTFSRTARRFGVDRAPTRYQEASFDLQPQENFHYTPVWDPGREIYDSRRTALRMADWDRMTDPRRFYYATYVSKRARMQEDAEQNFDAAQKHGLVRLLSDQERDHIKSTLLPLRHVEWAANLNSCFVTGYCYGSSMAQMAMFNAVDRLGIAQYLTKIGLLIDGNTGSSLRSAKATWMGETDWQPLRHYCEDLLVLKDWFELLLAQSVLDAFVHPILLIDRSHNYQEGVASTFIGMVTEFMVSWYTESTRWIDAVAKIAVGESPQNHDLIRQWISHWRERALEAVAPLATQVHDTTASQRLKAAEEQLEQRLRRVGLRSIKETR